ncbi:hypothetical protein EDB84DRAFT_1523844 [Lactarius hengduanensis]|nr:hypothetical protein EDB84DRAFT_1523844 [Lactarius hengduanensis]
MFPLRLAKVILTGTGILALRALAILSFRGPPLTLKSYRRRRVSEQAKVLSLTFLSVSRAFSSDLMFILRLP